MAQRSGADPPPLSLIQEYEDAEGSGKKRGEMEGGKRNTTMKKMQLTKKRPGQLMGCAKKSAKGRGKTMKRRTIWIPRQQEEVGKQVGKSDKDTTTPEGRRETPPAATRKGMEEEEKKREDRRWREAFTSPNQQGVELTHDEGKQQQTEKTEEKNLTEVVKKMKENEDAAREGTEQETISTSTQNRGQPGEMPKKRQRTILEYIEQSQQEGKETGNPNGDKQKEQKQRLQLEHPWEGEYYQQEEMKSVEEAAGNQDNQVSNQIVAEHKQQQTRQ